MTLFIAQTQFLHEIGSGFSLRRNNYLTELLVPKVSNYLDLAIKKGLT